LQELVKLLASQGDSKSSQALVQTMPAGMLADHQVSFLPDFSRIEPFIIERIFKDAVGVQARLV
jgi:hypothetical protein